jgi:predicted pyridoxine 5'-phosphate oxidase superfamily flavin-nucleotide-binding protein
VAGRRGFLQVLDEHTIAFVDFAGNRQYITQGNLEENPKAHLFLIDYAHGVASRCGARRAWWKETRRCFAA